MSGIQAIQLRYDLTDSLTSHQQPLWERDEQKRIYLNTRLLCELWGLSWKGHPASPYSKFSVNGNDIPRSRAVRILYMFQLSKINYNITSQTLEGYCPKNILVKIKKGLTKL